MHTSRGAHQRELSSETLLKESEGEGDREVETMRRTAALPQQEAEKMRYWTDYYLGTYRCSCRRRRAAKGGEDEGGEWESHCVNVRFLGTVLCCSTQKEVFGEFCCHHNLNSNG